MILEGEHIYLRHLERSDLDDFCRWYCDGQVTKFLGMKPLSRDRAETMFKSSSNSPNAVYFGIVRKDAERIIGYAFLSSILKSHRVAREFGIVIGDKRLWGQGYGTEAARLTIEYGFRHLRLHRIELLVLDFNKRARRMYKRLGFVEEGTQREARLIDGQWHNVIMISILENEYKER